MKQQHTSGKRYETKQRKKLDILVYLSNHPAASYEEIAVAVGWPETFRSQAHGYCKELIEAGCLEVTRDGSRALALTRKGRQAAREWKREEAEETK